MKYFDHCHVFAVAKLKGNRSDTLRAANFASRKFFFNILIPTRFLKNGRENKVSGTEKS